MTIFTVPTLSGGGGGGVTGPPGASDARYYLRYTYEGGIPAGGTQALTLGGLVFATQTGDLVTDDATLRGISVTVNVADPANDYEVRVYSDPSGAGGTGPTLLGSLALPSTQLRARRRDLALAVTGLLDLGVFVTRVGGAGKSNFDQVAVLVEVSIP